MDLVLPAVVENPRNLHARDHNLIRQAFVDVEDAVNDLLLASHPVTEYGAVGDGVTNDTAAFTAAALAAGTGGAIEVPPGTYKVSTLTFGCRVIFTGGVLSLTGTLTFGAPIWAGVSQIFSGGTVLFTCHQIGLPEWWGAKMSTESGGSRSANRQAIQASYAACAVTQLRAGTYLIDSHLSLQTSSRVLRGVANRWGGTSNSYGGTRVLVNSATDHVIEVLTNTSSNDNTTWVRNVSVEDIQFGREVTPAGTAPGVKMSRAIYCRMVRVQSAEHYRPFHISGVVDSEFDDCYAFSSSGSSGTFSGFYLDGSASIGLSGGNASVTLRHCSASCYATGVTAYGFHLTGRYVDTFLEFPETVNCDIGIYLVGNTGDSTLYGYNDVHINTPIMDAFKIAGIKIEDQKADGMVAINGGYCAPKSGASAVAGLILDTISGQTAVSNFEIDCGAVTTCTGVWLVASTGLMAHGVRVADSVTPLLIDADSSRNSIQIAAFVRALGGTTLFDIAGDRNVIDCGAWGSGTGQFTDAAAISGDRNVVTVARVQESLVTNVYTDTGSANVILGGSVGVVVPTSFGPWSAYTPTWGTSGTPPSLGDGTIVGRQRRIGGEVEFRITLTLGSTSTVGTGGWTFTLPVAGTVVVQDFGVTGDIVDTSTGDMWPIKAERIDVNTFYIRAASQPSARVTGSAPFTVTPADADYVTLVGRYEPA